MAKIDLNKKIYNMSGDIVNHKYYKLVDKQVTPVDEDMTIRIAIQNALLTKLAEDKPENFVSRKKLIDKLKDVDTIEFTPEEIEYINFSVMRKYEIYEAAQILEEIN